MAKKFSFRLESLLNLRSHRVNEALESLKSVVESRRIKEREIEINTDYYNSLNIIGKNQKIQASEVQTRFHHSNIIKEKIKDLEKEKIEILEIEEFRRKLLTEAMKEEKILEKLKDKKHEIYLKELNDEEMKMINSIALSRFDKQDNLMK